jgi:hypothetical protein
MPRFMRIATLFLLTALVGGCENAVTPCGEFAAPQARQAAPKDCPPKPVTEQPYRPARYCYRSLGQPDCFSEPQPGRANDFLGSYP